MNIFSDKFGQMNYHYASDCAPIEFSPFEIFVTSNGFCMLDSLIFLDLAEKSLIEWALELSFESGTRSDLLLALELL